MGWRLCTYTLTLGLAISALGAGAVHLPVLIAYGAAVTCSALVAAQLHGENVPSSGWNERLWPIAAITLAIYCWLQALPLPLSWLAAVVPGTAEIWASSFQLFEPPRPEFGALSLAPRRTLNEALEVASYGAVFVAAAALSRHYGTHRVLWLPFGLGLAVALVSAAHQVVGAEHLYGMYEPIDAYSVAPLLNANNRAGYLNLSFFCGLGLLFRTGLKPYAALIGLGLAFIVAEILLCESLGGTMTLALGAAGVVLLPRRAERSRAPREFAWALEAAIVAAIAAGGILMALGVRRSALGLGDRSLEKLELASKTVKLIGEHPWFGVGRGAFGSVFATYQGSSANVIAEHAENFPLQWAAEWGLPIAGFALLALGWQLVTIVNRRTLGSPSRRAAFVGCLALLLQNFADLGLEVPAISALLFFVLGALSAGREQASDTPLVNRSTWRRFLPWATPAVSAACLGLVLSWGVESTGRLRHDLYLRVSEHPGAPSPAFWTDLYDSLRTYPGEPYFPLLGSSAALAAKRNPLPWISRALQRNPTNAEAHLQLARILRAYGHTSQAVGALRRAIDLDPRQTAAVFRLGKEWQLSNDELAGAAPDGPVGAHLTLLLAGRAKEGPARQRLLEQALERDPANSDAHYHLAAELFKELSRKPPDSTCADRKEACLARAEDHARRGQNAETSRSPILLARLLAERGRPQEAEAQLADVCETRPGDTACADALVGLALANGSPRLEAAVKRLIAAACKNREHCAATQLTLGHRFAGAGEWGLAIGHYRRAAEEVPSPAALLALARAAERLGQDSLANDARRRAELMSETSRAAKAIEATHPGYHPRPSGATPLEPEGTD